MRFAVPTDVLIVWLLAVPVVAAIVLAAAGLAIRRRARERFAEPELMARIAPGASLQRLRLRLVLLVLAVVFLGLAAGRPQIGTKLGVARRVGVDLLIALDVSDSMRAEDLNPNRLERAKRQALSLIDLLKGDRVGVVVFSGEAFVQCPLTLDYGAATMLLSAVQPGTLERPGTALGEAIETSREALSTEPDRSKVLVVMTDGEDHGSEPVEAAGRAAEAGIRIYTIGFGSSSGEPIPLDSAQGGGYKRDSDGDVVMSRLDEATLMEVAEASGGRYFRASNTDRELAVIEEELSKMQQGELESRMMAYYEERYQIPLAVALCFLAAATFIPERVRTKEDA
ncbi:MAG: VWA domain-containing protein [Candidatus Eisenbacteria bacterium]|nr:VWA domain-containing protein [Candidatus Eisenbacteria bacterium]